jgi:tRNA-specific 2-thiouridylase
MPLWKLSKDEVREIAVKAGLPVADKPDSQEICFVPDGHYTDFILENVKEKLPPEGDFVDEDGRVIGRHKGIIHYTVGQRKGLGLPLGYPAYVSKICADTNEVVIGTADSLLNDTLICDNVNFMGIERPADGTVIKCRVKIRYHYTPQSAGAELLGDGRIRIVFDEPVRAAAPGQSAVMYDDDDCVIGGGIIRQVGDRI